MEQISLFDLTTLEEVDAGAPAPSVSPEIPTQETTPEKPSICFAEVPESEYKIDNGEPIPTITEIIKLFDKCPLKYSNSEILSDLFELGALSISNSVDFRKGVYERREKRFKELTEKYKADFIFIQNVFNKIYTLLASQTNPRGRFNDWLGELYMQSLTSSSKAGQFFTPYSVSKACALMAIDPKTIQVAKDGDKIITIHEPAVGAGGMVIAALEVLYSENRFNYARNVFIDCGDIDKRCVHMTYLQLALAGVPAVVWHRDGLSLETWDCFHTPALCMQWSRFKPLVRKSYEYLKGVEINF